MTKAENTLTGPFRQVCCFLCICAIVYMAFASYRIRLSPFLVLLQRGTVKPLALTLAKPQASDLTVFFYLVMARRLTYPDVFKLRLKCNFTF